MSNLREAVAVAQRLRAGGQCDWFRGQTRNWPLLSSFARRDEAGRNAAQERLARFHAWLESVPQTAALASDTDAALAIAQHYGIPTPLIDFSTEPAVAAFFATYDPPESHVGDRSCIVCVDTDELMTVWQAVRARRPSWPDRMCVLVGVPELWRLEAQSGTFLLYPFDEGFERHVFGFDRIIFPPETDPTVIADIIPADDIYPPQKSELEILLDQYFMLEKLSASQELLDQADAIIVEAPVDGVERECFVAAGLPVHHSWAEDRVAAWLRPAPEAWIPLSGASQLVVPQPPVTDPVAAVDTIAVAILDTFKAQPECRRTPVRWVALDGSPTLENDALSLLWDGLRRWPFADADVARGLATTAVLARLIHASPAARFDGGLADALVERCLGGPAVEVEIGMSDGSYTRGHARVDDLRAAVRPDLATYLSDRWRPQITSISAVLQVASVPQRVFDFDALTAVFARQIAATQVALRGAETGKARLYNPTRAERIGLP